MIGAGLLGLNSLPLFDWDEINFAETGREMLETGSYLQPTVNFRPFHEKPPLFIWLQVASLHSWGISSIGARFPNVICGLLTSLLLWWYGNRQETGLGEWWAGFLSLSVLPLIYFRSGIIDPWFNLFILLSLVPVFRPGLNWKGILFGGLWLGLAVLTKGPAAGLIAGLCWASLLLWRSSQCPARMIQYFLIGLLSLIPIGIWLFFLWQEDNGFFAREFLNYQWRLFIKEDAGHGGFPGYHAVVLLLGCFPAGIFALPALFRRWHFNNPMDQGMRILFWVVLILFSVVNTKIIHYSSLAYFPLAWFAARGIREGYLLKDWRRVRNLSGSIWVLYALAATSLPIVAWNLAKIIPSLRDAELVSRLQLPVTWPWWTLLPSLLIIAGLMITRRIKADQKKVAALQLLLSALFVLIALPVFAPRIQQYSQGALIAFYQEQAGKDVYYGTAYHKSYAHWFYGAVRPETYAGGCQERQCRFHGAIDQPLYFSSPLRKTEQVLREVRDAELLYQRGGFSFYLRPANSQE